jgi:hypothetical protein
MVVALLASLETRTGFEQLLDDSLLEASGFLALGSQDHG